MRKRKVRKRLSLFMVWVMVFSLFTGMTPLQSVQAEESKAEDSLRIHYDYGENDLSQVGAWLWGDVADPSDTTGEWPDGTWFEEGGTDDYGAYIDVALKEDAQAIGLKINNRAGEDVTDDISIDMLSDQMDEVWITTSGEVYYYEPTHFDENILRVHYETEDKVYEPWGVWTWGDVADAPSDWPMDAHAFSDGQVGPHGAYVDIPLSENPGSIGFLLMTRDEQADENKTSDINFADFENHRQIFLKQGEEGYYTNPYYVSTEVEEEEPEEQEGELDIQVEGSVNRAFTYNDHAVLTLDITNTTEKSIRSIYADATALGGKERLEISPELKEISLSVSHTIEAGEKDIPITVVDEDGGTYKTEVTATVAERNPSEDTVDWDESLIYFMLTDRFYDGDEANNDPYGLDYSSYDNDRGTYQGGDFKGVMEKLDYLDELGVNTIWITPIVENVGYDVNYDASEGSFFGYHGYWAKDFETLNPHLGTLKELHELIDAAATRDMKIMADVVLNHAGYGLKDSVANEPAGYPTDEDRNKFDGMVREKSGSGDLQMELSGLPDFKTEEAEVRNQMVAWQKDWVEKSTTDQGNSIAYYRVDTVKHVDDTTWQHFRNELTKEKPDFQLIGEAWGAGKSDDQGYLETGMMDSLLDFEFKGTAKNFVNGKIDSANDALTVRNESMDNTTLLGQFLGSHDEDGFLYSLNGDVGKMKVAASLQMTSKGQPVIYYGEELGQTGANNWPTYDNRYNLDWDSVEDNDMLAHYQKTIDFRSKYSDIFAKGTRSKIAGSDQEQYLLFERSYSGSNAYVALNVAEKSQTITVQVDSEDVTMTDHYQNTTYEAVENDNGEFEITMNIPGIDEGGTSLLSLSTGAILSGETEDEETKPETTEIPEGYLRVHFPGNNQNIDELGLWVWEDVTAESEVNGSWPSGATSFKKENQTDYGHFIDVELADDAKTVGMLINNATGDNLSGDIMVDLLSPDMNQVWITDDYQVYPYEPIDKDNNIRVNFYQEEESYDHFGLWTWGDVAEPTSDWPNGAHYLADDRIGLKGSYVELALAENASNIQFLVLNKETDWQTGDITFNELSKHSQIFIREGDDTVYTNPYFVKEEGLVNGEVLSDKKIELMYSSVSGLTEEQLKEEIHIVDKDGNEITFESISISEEDATVTLNGSFDLEKAPFTITHNGRKVTASIGWRLKDEMYGYDGDLGLEVHDASHATLRLWSPSADNVSVVLYDKEDQSKIIKDDISMSRGEKGLWEVELNKKTTGLDDIRGYYYHFSIERDGETVLTLDPYAKSMAAWDSDNGDHKVGKAAIVDPSTIGPELEYASIDGFEKREDAIIYEIHVRDFTSDPSIDEELNSQFGTFASFVDKLDYIEDLGVTHIQLLPVMSYYFADELNKDERLLNYSSTDNNYNWGYDPQSYFSLTGMYSENPEDPAKRIEEFKHLIDEIHSRDMGVVLDVVYNHTAQVDIFEDLEPNYYHFMDADGTPRESFGGGRLGTTHKMARRVLVDSITYWVDEFKIDGFRFDMMGDHDAESIQLAYEEAKALNPNIVMIGEGWVTYAGDENYPNIQPADQSWMEHTESVASFSDEFRNQLKSGFGSEGQPRFLTGGARDIQNIFNNITAKPGNFTADDPGDVVPYIAAHDNLTLHDVIAQSIQKDPKDHSEEIHQRIRLGNLMTLTSQGTPFIHAGQEYGRTKQFLHEDYKGEVAEAPYKSTYLTDENGEPFEYPYFIHDSYDSTDAVNMFDWSKATDQEAYPTQTATRAYTKGLIELRRSTDAFRHATMDEVDEKVSLIETPEIAEEDLIIGYRAEDSNGEFAYYVIVNADNNKREISIDEDLTTGDILVDAKESGTEAIDKPKGVVVSKNGIEINGLTATIIRMEAHSDGKEEDDASENEDNKDESDENDTPENDENEDSKDETDENDTPDNDENEDKKDETDENDTSDKGTENADGNIGKEMKLPNDIFENVSKEGKVSFEMEEEDDNENHISVVVSKDDLEQFENYPLEIIRKDVSVLFPIQNSNGKGFQIGLERLTSDVNLKAGHKIVSAIYAFNATDEDGNKLTSFDPPVTLTFEVDANKVEDVSKLKGVYLADDGSYQYFEGEYSEAESTFTFDVDHFSSFTVMEVEEELVEGNTLPSTATNLYTYLLIGFLFVLVGMPILFYKRKR